MEASLAVSGRSQQVRLAALRRQRFAWSQSGAGMESKKRLGIVLFLLMLVTTQRGRGPRAGRAPPIDQGGSKAGTYADDGAIGHSTRGKVPCSNIE
jgi:hypothetical protein